MGGFVEAAQCGSYSFCRLDDVGRYKLLSLS